MWPGVAPVVPELLGDDDTSNFSPMEDPDAVSEGFDLTKVKYYCLKSIYCTVVEIIKNHIFVFFNFKSWKF